VNESDPGLICQRVFCTVPNFIGPRFAMPPRQQQLRASKRLKPYVGTYVLRESKSRYGHSIKKTAIMQDTPCWGDICRIPPDLKYYVAYPLEKSRIFLKRDKPENFQYHQRDPRMYVHNSGLQIPRTRLRLTMYLTTFLHNGIRREAVNRCERSAQHLCTYYTLVERRQENVR
jgi:hypothetical protein